MIEQRIYDAQYMCRKYGAFAAYTQCLLLAGLGLAGLWLGWAVWAGLAKLGLCWAVGVGMGWASWGWAGSDPAQSNPAQPGQGQASPAPDQPM